jgi:CRISPR-associated protein Cas1
MAYEGNSSKHYYSTLAYLIPQEFKFEGRSRRPAKDEFNAMLNYAFGVLYGKVEKALIVAGLDPYIGILHTDNYNKKSLVFDIIEKYRFIATKTVFSLFSTKKVNKNYFDKITKGLKLNKDGKQVLLKNLTEKFEKRKRYNGRMLTNLQIIQHEAHELANRLIEGEK